MKNNNELGIYIHIPFCMQKCIYCDFLSAPADDKTKSSYVKALINEIALSEAGLDKIVTSIFIGGGTPSSINAEYIKDILEAVKQRYRVDGNAEITIECNPGTINSEKAYIYREAGINRISFGLQSTDDKELRMLGRIHTFEQFKNSLAIARNAGFTNINIDLMSALPGQTIESFTRVLKEAVSLNTEHISVYSLIIEEGTRLYDNIDNYPDIPDDDDDRKMYALTKEILGQAGYERYEISNYAKAGYECKHNLKYWDRTDYIGFGIGAASLCNHKRYTNISDINNYIKALCVEYADNKESYFKASYVPIINTEAEKDEPRKLGDVILLKNITEFKELDSAKTTFISTISHELKTPIAAIMMSLQLLEDKRVGALNDEQEQLSKSIKENSERLLGITGELLNMTQVEAGKLQLMPKITKPIELIEYAIKANQVQADKFNIQIEVEYPEEKIGKLFVDSEKIAWVLTNLLSNAIRYSKENGRVVIGAKQEDNIIELYVQDFGKGIDPRYHKSIFDRYFRVPGTKVQGSGLGLSISRDFVEAHGGTLTVESELGKGSRFVIRLKA